MSSVITINVESVNADVLNVIDIKVALGLEINMIK